jgi:hypothetical protein
MLTRRFPRPNSIVRRFVTTAGSGYGQAALVVASWILLCLLHWDNDGLWYPQDAPRHLINGVFVKDYLAAGLPPPVEYAQSYLIRYPIICPTKYPPCFYLLEAAAFSILAPSPWAAKNLVLGFALLAALYQMAWLRRFVDPESGYLGAVLPLLPCMVEYSHAILLNVPAFAIQLAALYHARCWLDAGGRRHLYLAAGFVLSALFFYQGTAVLMLILGTWLALIGRWRLLLDRRVVVAAVAVLSVPILLLAWSLRSSGQIRWLFDSPYLRYAVTWLWYPRKMPGAFGPIVLVGAVLGATAGALSDRWRAELTFSGGWIVTTYLFHTYLFGKDVRYILPLCTPLLSLTAVAVWWPLRSLGRRLGPRVALSAASVAIASLLAMHVWLARSVVLPRVDGFEAIVATIRADEGPDPSSILADLDAQEWTLLTCFVRLDDPEFRLRVLPASWFWDFAGLSPGSALGNSGRVATGAIESSLAHSGCRWIVVKVDAEPGKSSPRPADRRLRELLRPPRFEHVRTFSIRGDSPSTAALYRQVGPIEDLASLARRGRSGNDRMKWLLRDPITRAR